MGQTYNSLSGLYYRYKKTSDENIREYLKDIKLVILTNKGVALVPITSFCQFVKFCAKVSIFFFDVWFWYKVG